MENMLDNEIEEKNRGMHHMPKAVPAILLSIFLERFSATAMSSK